MPKALWTNGMYWNSPVQLGAHHYVRQLLRRGWDVAFVSDPISPLHALYRSTYPESRDRFRTWWRRGQRDWQGHLFYYTPLTLLPPFNAPLLRMPWVLDHWHRLTVPDVRRVLRSAGFDRVDLLVADSIAQGFWLDEVKAERTLTRVADHLAGFDHTTEAMVERERDLIRRVDVVAYTAKTLEPMIRAAGAKQLVHVPNGVDAEHFIQGGRMIPDEYQSIPQPRVVYVGAIKTWFDVALLQQVATRLEGVSFVLVGPHSVDISELNRLTNVYVLGRRSYSEVPRYLKHAQVGMIPFKVNQLVDAVNPLKLYEYMACGLPVVATSWKELRQIDSPAVLCDSAEDFSNAIEKAIAEKSDRQALVNFASRADWSRRFESLAAAVGLDQLGS